MSDLFDKAKSAASGEQGEKISDSALDKGAAAAEKKAAGHEDAVQKARDEADKRIGS